MAPGVEAIRRYRVRRMRARCASYTVSPAVVYAACAFCPDAHVRRPREKFKHGRWRPGLPAYFTAHAQDVVCVPAARRAVECAAG